jgi:hypothetical protein
MNPTGNETHMTLDDALAVFAEDFPDAVSFASTDSPLSSWSTVPASELPPVVVIRIAGKIVAITDPLGEYGEEWLGHAAPGRCAGECDFHGV